MIDTLLLSTSMSGDYLKTLFHLGTKHGCIAEGCFLAAVETPDGFSRRSRGNMENMTLVLVRKSSASSHLRFGMPREVRSAAVICSLVEEAVTTLGLVLVGMPGLGPCIQGMVVERGGS